MIKKLLLLVMLSGLLLEGYSQKVAGYFPSYRSGYLNTVKWDKLTDCYFAFINADASGNLITTNTDPVFGFDNTTFLNVKSKCTANNVKLHISVGGADNNYQRAARLNTIAGNSTACNNFAAKIVQFAIDNGLAGINIDWEFPNASIGGSGGTTANHETLITAVRTAINASTNKSLLLGVAVGGEWAGTIKHTNYINTTAISKIDEFHIMAYDLPAGGGSTGLPYDPNHHSSVANAASSLDGWNTKGVPYNKMVLGVPFYGRRSDRSTDDLTGMYNNFSNADPSGTYNDADGVITSGGNTWYYDSKVTLESKITSAMTKGCLGVFAWDLGQDRGDQYSLLDAMKTKMNTVCTIPDPNLGPDQGFCTGSVTLNPQVPTASGRTFTWQKDGADISGYVASTTANTYAASVAGVYKVTINQGTGCTKSATIKVISGSSVTATGAARCGAGTVTLTINNTSGTYDWFDAATGGSKLTTGMTYSPNVTATTDFYVQQNTGSVDYNAGRATALNAPNAAWNEASKNDDGTKARFAQKLIAYTDITLKTVRVFTSSTAINAASIVIYKSDGATVQAQTTPVNIPANAGSYLFTVNQTLQGSVAGTVYYVGVYSTNGTGATGPGFTLDRNVNASDFTQASVYTIEKGCYISYSGAYPLGGQQTNYGQLFDWTIMTGVASPCGRTKVTATVNTAPNAGLALSAQASPICQGVDGGVVIQSSQANVNYDVFKGTTQINALSVAGTGSNLTIPVTSANLTAGTNTFTVKASSVGCTDVQLTNTAAITVNTAPSAPGAITGAASVTKGQSNVPYSVGTVSGATSYTWSYSGTGATFTTTTNTTNANFSATATSGDITVKAVNACGSSVAASPVMSVVVSSATEVLEMTKENGFNIYPNPLSDASQIVITLDKEVKGNLVLVDIYGAEMLNMKNTTLNAGNNSISLPNLATGIYVLKLEANGKVYSHKVVKNK